MTMKQVPNLNLDAGVQILFTFLLIGLVSIFDLYYQHLLTHCSFINKKNSKLTHHLMSHL